MLTISSISVSPWPQQTPTVKAQPVSASKTSHAVSPENAGGTVAVNALPEGGIAQAVYTPSALPPVDPTGESVQTTLWNNAAAPERATLSGAVQSALAQREVAQSISADATVARTPESPPDAQPSQLAAVANKQEALQEVTRYRGELPPADKPPEQKALDTQINELVPNLWKASRAAVDVLIGEEAKAAAAARAEVLAQVVAAPEPVLSEKALEATETYAAQASQGQGPPVPGTVLNENA